METIQLFSDFCEKLEQTSSRKAKEHILAEALKNDRVAELFRLGLDCYEMFYVSLSEANASGKQAATYEEVLETCINLSTRAIIGSEAYAVAEKVFVTKCLRRMVNKNLRCGVAAKTINKLRPGFVRELELMLPDNVRLEEGQSFTELRFDLQGDWWIQKELNGLRCLCVLSGGRTHFYPRTGRSLSTLGKIEAELRAHVDQNIVFDGELLIGDGPGDLDSIARIAHADVRELPEEELAKLRYYITDAIPIREWATKNFTTPFSKRRALLHTIFPRPEELSFLRIAELEIANFSSELQPMQHAKAGFVGSILREGAAPYELKRSSSMLRYRQGATAPIPKDL